MHSLSHEDSVSRPQALFHASLTCVVGDCCPILDRLENNYSCRFDRTPGREYRCNACDTMIRVSTALLESCAGESEGEIRSLTLGGRNYGVGLLRLNYLVQPLDLPSGRIIC